MGAAGCKHRGDLETHEAPRRHGGRDTLAGRRRPDDVAMMPGLIVLFVAYAALSAWQARRALAAPPATKQAEAIRFLLVTFLGVPIAVGMILAL